MYEKMIISKTDLEDLKSKDEKMSLLINSIGEINRECIPDPFVALVNSIVYQQLSFKAAISIWSRLEEYLKEITPDSIINANFHSLRECGLSKTKISYIKNIAEAVNSNELDFEQFDTMTDKEIIEKLVKIKGIGEWTGEMFLIFSLKRKDVLSYKDLAIRRGLKWLYNMKVEPSKKEFEQFKKLFSPYNTLASFYLWEITIRNYFKYESIEEII